MSNVYVFRINYDDKFKMIRDELIKGRLRQGWGIEGMSLDGTLEEFKTSWRDAWGGDDSEDDYIRRKYNNLLIMKEFQEGDIIVIPKIDINGNKDYPCQCFTVVKCRKPYSFSVLQNCGDFGHYVDVEILFSCSYYGDKLSPITIAGKFKAYQRAINRVGNDVFINALNELIGENEKNHITTDVERKEYSFIMAQELSDKYEKLVVDNLNNLQKLDPKSFEYLIRELFEKNGFICSRMNEYDGEGGDIDIQMMLNDKSLLGAVFKQAKGVDNLFINIQAKKKQGHDWDSRKAVDQLLIKRESNKKRGQFIDIVIDLTDGYDTDTEEYAEKNDVILINGMQFSSLLLQFGFVGELDF